jgi:hypothetical protein
MSGRRGRRNSFWRNDPDHYRLHTLYDKIGGHPLRVTNEDFSVIFAERREVPFGAPNQKPESARRCIALLREPDFAKRVAGRSRTSQAKIGRQK